MRRTALLLAASTAICLPGTALAMEGVVASIKPVHSLVAGVMEGVGEPELLVKGAASPHSYAMRPSEAAMLEDASLVFWIGGGMETFLTEPLATLGADAETVALEHADGLTLLEYREGGAFEAHDHGHDEAGHEEHGHENGDDHEAAHAADHAEEEDHAHEAAHPEEHHHEPGGDHAGHDHSGHDLHIWLDPENAKAMVGAIEEALSEADPANAEAYAANAEAMTARLDTLSQEVASKLAPVADRPFVVFHDAYHYFEDRFGLEAAGAITVSPEVDPGARRIAEMQETVRDLGATCVFAEPQFEPRIVEVVAEGSSAASGILDPLGADLPDGPELYFDLIRTMAMSFATCLAGND